MKRFDQKTTVLFFYAFDFILVLALALSFIPASCSERNKDLQNELLSPDHRSECSIIEIKNPDDGAKITMRKYGNIWTGTDSYSNNTFYWPCDASMVESFLDALASDSEPVIAAEKESSLKNFCLDSKSAVQINVFGPKKNNFASLYFGKTDSTGSKIYVRTWKDKRTLLVDNVAPYIDCSPEFWSEKEIFPRSVTESKDCILTRGPMVYLKPPLSLEPAETLKKDFGNSSEAIFRVYPKDDGYVIIPTFKAGIGRPEQESKAISELNYRYSVSETTLERIREEMKRNK